jgi:hypothetical protein
VEVARRGLAGHKDAAGADDEGSPQTAAESEGMVELSTFTDVDDARMALALLKAAEIPCWLENEDPAASWMGTPGFGKFRLSVPPDYLEQAREVLETEISDEELAAQAEAAGELDEEDDEPEQGG